MIDLLDHPLPIYSHELEEAGLPPEALALKAALKAQDGQIVATPEHNGSIPALLKNALDWASRATNGEPPLALAAFKSKPAALLSTSPSPFGGMRAITHLRQILPTMQMLVIPEQVVVPFAPAGIVDGQLKDALPAALLDAMVARLIEIAEKLRSD